MVSYNPGDIENLYCANCKIFYTAADNQNIPKGVEPAGAIEVYTVYDHPYDYPDHYVCRKFYSKKDGTVASDPEPFLVTKNLHEIEMLMHGMQKIFMPRMPQDVKPIIGSYI